MAMKWCISWNKRKVSFHNKILLRYIFLGGYIWGGDTCSIGQIKFLSSGFFSIGQKMLDEKNLTFLRKMSFLTFSDKRSHFYLLCEENSSKSVVSPPFVTQCFSLPCPPFLSFRLSVALSGFFSSKCVVHSLHNLLSLSLPSLSPCYRSLVSFQCHPSLPLPLP